MSKTYCFLQEIDTSQLPKTVCPDVYCPPGGYEDKNLNQVFTSKGEKFRYLRQYGMREAEPYHPDQGIGGTEGCNIKRRGSRGTFRARPLPEGMRKELARHVG